MRPGRYSCSTSGGGSGLWEARRLAKGLEQIWGGSVAETGRARLRIRLVASSGRTMATERKLKVSAEEALSAVEQALLDPPQSDAASGTGDSYAPKLPGIRENELDNGNPISE